MLLEMGLVGEQSLEIITVLRDNDSKCIEVDTELSPLCALSHLILKTSLWDNTNFNPRE